jgi:hypothetical protein
MIEKTCYPGFRCIRQVNYQSLDSGVCSCQNCQTILDNHCLRRPDSVQLSTVPATLQKVIGSGAALEGMWIGTFPHRASASPTTLRVCSFAYGPGIPSTGCPSEMLLPSDL